MTETSGRESLFAVAWSRTLTGEAGYVRSVNKYGIQVTAHLSDAGLFERHEADLLVERMKGFVATYAYTVGVAA